MGEYGEHHLLEVHLEVPLEVTLEVPFENVFVGHVASCTSKTPMRHAERKVESTIGRMALRQRSDCGCYWCSAGAWYICQETSSPTTKGPQNIPDG